MGTVRDKWIQLGYKGTMGDMGAKGTYGCTGRRERCNGVQIGTVGDIWVQLATNGYNGYRWVHCWTSVQ